MSLLRKSTGFFLVFTFISLFSFSFIGVTNEFKQVQTIDALLDDKITTDDFTLNINSYMYDFNGHLISEIYSNENRIYLPFSSIPTHAVNAVIATEDQHFFSHKGFDMNGIVRALLVNAENQAIEQGGSTITQQLVKQIYLSNERTYNRKLTEVLYAYKIEQLFSKEKILEYYLNTIYFQNGVYGIEAASKFYFSRPSKELSVAEIAFLSAIPNNPTFYNPFVYPDNTNKRKDWVLAKMLELNFISENQYLAAKEEKIEVKRKNKIDLFPDYVTYIHYELEQLIGEKEGFNEKIKTASTNEEKAYFIDERQKRTKELIASGIHIYTALDPQMQEKVSEVVERHLSNQEIQASAVMIDHDSKNIVAISGGRGYQKFEFHRGYQAFRQPGSSIKPLLVYGPYLSETNGSIYSTISGAPFCKNGYCPQNYGGSTYGNVKLETALKKSYNTAAVRMLDQIGIKTAFSYFHKLGFSKIDEGDERLPAALGGLTYGVSPLEMTNAYTVFANEGTFQKARGIKKVLDQNGEVLFEWDDEPKTVWNKDTNTKMRSLLKKVITEGTARKALFQAEYIGGKTGTTNDFHDLWFIGLNQKYTTGVWIGYDQPKSLNHYSTQSPHLLIWRDIMKD